MPRFPIPVSNTPWYHDGLKFKCTGCGDCCTGAPGYVWVNKAEIGAMAAAIRVDVETFQRRYVRRIGIRRSLLEFPNGDCVFFDAQRRTCQVYDVRPRQCRTWPFWASNLRSPSSWAQMARQCPGADHGPVVPLDDIEAQSSAIRV